MSDKGRDRPIVDISTYAVEGSAYDKRDGADMNPAHRSDGHWVIAALLAGIAAAAIEFCYLFGVRPFQADLGIQASGGLILGWLILALIAFRQKARRAWLTLLPAPVALIGPVLLALLVVGCSLNDASCP